MNKTMFDTHTHLISLQRLQANMSIKVPVAAVTKMGLTGIDKDDDAYLSVWNGQFDKEGKSSFVLLGFCCNMQNAK